MLKVAPGWTITAVNITFVDRHAEVNGQLNSTVCMNMTTCDAAWPEATWTYQGSKAEGAFTEGWNWWTGYWDPSMNSPGVVTNHQPDEVWFTIQYTVAGYGTTRSGETSTMVGVLGSVLYPRLGP